MIKSAFQLVPSSLKHRDVAFWFGVSFITPFYYGLISFFYANSSAYIVQDDARYHIVWLQRLIDPDLFPNDVMADYYSAIQGIGFRSFYALAASLGIEPLAFAKIVPLLLALVTTVYLFWTALLILPVPICGALTTILLNQNIWIRDDLISASPRAFVYPLFAAFLYYLLRDSKVLCLSLAWAAEFVLSTDGAGCGWHVDAEADPLGWAETKATETVARLWLLAHVRRW